MLNQNNVILGQNRSAIRELFEYAKKRKTEIGEENVFDFSIGNPSVPPPVEVETALSDLINTASFEELHGYTSAHGCYSVRKVIADYLNGKFNTSLNAECLYMTCGAAASLTITLNALLNEGDEVIVFVPYFPEYKVYTEHARAKFVAVKCEEKTFLPDLNALKNTLSPATKAVIINSPNNPSGVVYGEEIIKNIAEILGDFYKKTGNAVYLISDEPYRELVYDGITVPFIMNYYSRSIVCYSYSKSLSLAGERIGYIAVNNAMEDFLEVYAAVCGAGRSLGFVCAPSLFQKLIERVCGITSDISVYERNRNLLYRALIEYGYEVVKPDGAFYMFVKSPEVDDKAFVERAKRYELLIVPGECFGYKGYVRVSYCVNTDVIERALPAFKSLAESYKLI